MTITREQVADLQPGDVVEFRDEDWPGTTITGPLVSTSIGLCLGNFTVVCWANGEPNERSRASLTVVSRAPRPLYVNHDRIQPVRGDVVRDADKPGAEDPRVWLMFSTASGYLPRWASSDGRIKEPEEMLARLRLLVDGETGQVVP